MNLALLMYESIMVCGTQMMKQQWFMWFQSLNILYIRIILTKILLKTTQFVSLRAYMPFFLFIF